MDWLARTTAKVCVAAVACGLSVGIALTVGVAAGNSGATASNTSSTSAPSQASTAPSDLAAAYQFLNSSSATHMPTALGADLDFAVQSYGVNPSLGREAGEVDSQTLWLVPGNSGSCIEIPDGGSSCGSNAVAEQNGLWLMLKPVSGAAPSLYGIVPDGAAVSAVGGSAAVTRSGDAVLVTPTSSATGHISIQSSGGTTEMTVPAATGSSQ